MVSASCALELRPTYQATFKRATDSFVRYCSETFPGMMLRNYDRSKLLPIPKVATLIGIYNTLATWSSDLVSIHRICSTLQAADSICRPPERVEVLAWL